ncbi:MAG: hypothetical protein HKP58_00530 [Desulfatitalea sp.]|nr:hypothetical protein [Desulfatitalea sp.]NNJ98876.1 hypothetical protein [Desulfatitalea sp.]
MEIRVQAKKNASRSRRIWVRPQGTSAGAYQVPVDETPQIYRKDKQDGGII